MGLISKYLTYGESKPYTEDARNGWLHFLVVIRCILGPEMQKNSIMAHSILPRIDKNFYKKCSPEETIHRIREILYKCGIYIMELSDTQDGFYHSHLHFANKELLQFGIQTNGKGMTPAYSLASAYAEMMERLQNAMLIGGRNRVTRAYLNTLPKDSLYRKRLEDADAVLEYEAFLIKSTKLC